MMNVQLAYGLGTAHYKTGPDALTSIDNKIIAATVMAIKSGYTHRQSPL